MNTKLSHYSLNMLAITAAVLIFTFIPFEIFFMQDVITIKPDTKYHVVVTDEKILHIPAPFLQDYDGQTDRLLPILVTQHTQSDFPASSVDLRDIHFINKIGYQSDAGGIANFPIPGNFDTGVKSEYGSQIIPIFGSDCTFIGYSLDVSCGQDDQREITYGSCSMPILRTFSDVLSTKVRSVFPERDGTYKMEFMSYFETDVELPDNANLLNHEILTCDVIGENEHFTQIYFHDVQFALWN